MNPRFACLSLAFAVFFTPVFAPAQTSHYENPNFIRVEGGTFVMGNAADNCCCFSAELPARNVTINGFYMSRHQVTQREWLEVMGANPSHFRGDHLLVENVSWFDVIEFANEKSRRAGLTPVYSINGTGTDRIVTWNRAANGYRLPTEAEWEFAARGGHGSPGGFIYSGSDNANLVAWHAGNSGGRTQAVGQLRPNALGLYDMSGNVWEWVWDWFGPYPSAAQANPAGASSGANRVLRGGSWSYSDWGTRSTFRYWFIPSSRSFSLGFRLVRPFGTAD